MRFTIVSLLSLLFMVGCITNEDDSYKNPWDAGRQKRLDSDVTNLIGSWSLVQYPDIEMWVEYHTINRVSQDTTIGYIKIRDDKKAYSYVYTQDTLYVQTQFMVDKMVRTEDIK